MLTYKPNQVSIIGGGEPTRLGLQGLTCFEFDHVIYQSSKDNGNQIDNKNDGKH